MHGMDTLRLTAGADLDLTTIANSLLTNIEHIDAEADTGANALILNTLDTLALSDESNDIFVQDDNSDTLTLAGDTFTASGTQAVGGETYNVLTDAGTDANVFVDQDVVVSV